MPESCYKLVELGIYSWATDELYASLWLASVCDALGDLQLCLADEGVEEMMKRIFAYSLQLMCVLGVPRLGSLLIVSPPGGSGAGCPLRLALRDAAIARCHCVHRAVCDGCAWVRPIRRKGLCY